MNLPLLPTRRSARTLLTTCFLALSMVLVPASHAESVTFKPEAVNYGGILMDSCRSRKITATNTGDTPIQNPAFSLTGDKAFQIQSMFDDHPPVLNPGEICIVYINFCPSLTHEYTGYLHFTGTNERVTLKGYGHAGKG